MSYTDGKPRFATEKELNGLWGGARGNFRCGFCGYKFKIGDYWRWVYTNDDIPGVYGNPLICEACDNGDVCQKWKDKWEEWMKDENWWILKRSG